MRSGEILNSNIETENSGVEDIMQTQQEKMQLKQDEFGEQLTFSNANPFMGSN